MKIVESPYEAYSQVQFWRGEGLRIGLVPTMGALHVGHLSLVERSREECDISLVSIFVNPTQFGPQEDFSRYPRTLSEDLSLLREQAVDLVFTPQPAHLYPPGFSTFVEPPAVAQPLEGLHRPQHFRGVTTIVLKLFHILPATVAYFGNKDFQQLTVIRRMVEDLNLPIRVEGCQTMREADGLAMSSRNRYLQPEERQTATVLFKTLTAVSEMVQSGQRNVAELERSMHRMLQASQIERIDYACLVDRETLESPKQVDRPCIALIAAYVGSTRLIDNLLID